MDNERAKFLHDILECIGNIEEYIGEPMQYENLRSNRMMQQAVERNLEIIGEAVKELLLLDKGIAITSARRIVDTRNKISHGYDEVDLPQIWSIIIRHLPVLKKECADLLAETTK